MDSVDDSCALTAGVPRVSTHLLPRDRLITLLEHEPSAALTILRAGTGFGKTALLAAWARGRTARDPLVWVTADESMRDPHRFWAEVLDGFDRVCLMTHAAEELRTSPAGGTMTSLRRAIADLPETATLVVDGYELLGGTDVEHELIHLLVHTDRLRVFVATQRSSELDSITTASRVDTRMVDAAELRFTQQELRELAARLGVGASPRELEDVHGALDGWPFGVRAVLARALAAEETAVDSQHDVFGVPTHHRPRLDPSFVTTRLLASLADVPGLDLLTETSVVERFTVAQALALGIDLESHPVLAELESRGMCVRRVAGEDCSYQLHPVLRRALRQRLDHDVRRTNAIFSRLSRWHLSRREFAQAFAAAVRAGQWAPAVRCARSDMLGVLALLRRQPDLLRAVPSAVLKREPLLMLASGIGQYSAGNHANAVRMLLAAAAACDRQHSGDRRAPGPDQVWAQGILTIALRLAGRYERVPGALRRFAAMLGAVDDPGGELDSAMLLFRTQAVVTLGFMDQLAAAEHVALDTVCERHPMSSVQQASLLALTAFTHARRGDAHRASAVLERMREHEPTHFGESYFAISGHVATAFTALERFDAHAANRALSRSERHWPTMEFWPFVLDAHARADWQLNGPESALLTLREGRAQKRFKAPIGDAMTLSLIALESELLLATGRRAEAAALMTSARLRRSHRLAVPRSRSLLLCGDWDQAASLADQHSQSEAQPWHSRIDLLLISASANLRAGDRDTAGRRFDRAFAIAERVAVRTPFASMPRADLIELGGEHQGLLDEINAQPVRYPEPTTAAALSRREHLVLAAIATDRTLSEIARMHSVSINTLKSQLRSMYRKLHVENRREAVSAARRAGLLLTPPEPARGVADR